MGDPNGIPRAVRQVPTLYTGAVPRGIRNMERCCVPPWQSREFDCRTAYQIDSPRLVVHTFNGKVDPSMAESSICRAEVSKNGKVNPSTTWTVFIRGVEHQVVLSRKWSQKVVVLYDGGVILDKRFVSKPPEGCFAAWAGDGVSFAVYYNSAIANRYELQVNGVEFSQLPLSAVVRAHRERQQRKRAEENARRQPKTYVLRAVRSTPSGKQLSAESCSSSSSGSGRNLRC